MQQILFYSNACMNTAVQEAIQNLLSPMKSYIADNNVTEIMYNGDNFIWIDTCKNGMQRTSSFINNTSAHALIRLVASFSGKVVENKNPAVSAKLFMHNARFQGALPPLSPVPIFSIRKILSIHETLQQYAEKNNMPAHQLSCLEHAIKNKLNILIAGSTGSGKTALANVLLSSISDMQERICIVEDTPELSYIQENTLHFLSSDSYSCADIMKDILRFRPDRIIVGEIRDGAALDVIKAWNTGHKGGIATIHANSGMAALDRLCSLIEERVPTASRSLIAESIDIIIFMKYQEKQRKIHSILKVNRGEKESFIMEELL